MQIFVQSHTLELHNVSENDTVATLRQQYGQDAALFVCGMPLEDNMLISEHVAELGTVEVSMKLLGGKVHGSLARAGKVKGQTPKVDKAEKKKKRTGRAKRRVQYNRRFVNTVAGFGRKKGPNSQSTA